MEHSNKAIEITRRVVSYRAKECRYADEDGHNRSGTGPQCTGECTWLDGDRRVIWEYQPKTITPDADDLDVFDGSAVRWAAYRLSQTDVTESSVSPIGAAVRAHCWLSGSYTDPYQGDSHVTETTARLTGEWTPAERAEVFRAVVGGK
ncbi:hypothetical protein ACZ90_00400 [Streptomyces albus subsp. albus]|nr:hypothetical protein ACZ90_00400 [Streptomyces albus subsp. albus]